MDQAAGKIGAGPIDKAKRVSRNMSEKLRRDRLKSHIEQLATKLPLVAMCGKKLDKCTILRLTVAFLKMHTGLRKMKLKGVGSWPDYLNCVQLEDFLQESMDGFFLVVSQRGTIVYVSEKITPLLGHAQFTLLGKPIFDILHEDDHQMLKAQFQSSSTDAVESNGYCSLYLRMMNLNEVSCLKTVHTPVHVVGTIQKFSLLKRSRCPENLNEKWLLATCRLQVSPSIREISLMDLNKSEWISQHKMDGSAFYIDNRFSCFTGYLPSEQIGYTPYQILHKDDLDAVANSHMKIMKEDLIPETIFRLKTANRNYIFIKSSSCVARDHWTKQAKFIVSLNQVLDEEEGTRKLAVQNKELQAKKEPKMFTDDILTIMSDALTGNISSLQDEVQCQNMDWGNSQYMTPVGNVIRSSVGNPQTEKASPITSTSTTASSTSTTPSRKRPAVDPFVKLIQESIMPDEEMDVSPSKCLQISSPTPSDCAPCSKACTSNEGNLMYRSNCKACCSNNKHSSSMLKSLLTEEHKQPSCSATSPRILSPSSCPQSPRTTVSESTVEDSVQSPQTESNQTETDVMSFSDPMSVKSSTSEQSMMSPESPSSPQQTFVTNFTEQLKQKHKLMEQSLLLQEATIFTLESEVNKVKGTGHSSPHLQKICERLRAIKASKARQQAELLCLQTKLNQQKKMNLSVSSPGSSSSQTSDCLSEPSTSSAQMFFGSESQSSTAQVDLGEIEPTFYPVISKENSKSTATYGYLKKGLGQSGYGLNSGKMKSILSQSQHVPNSHVDLPYRPFSQSQSSPYHIPTSHTNRSHHLQNNSHPGPINYSSQFSQSNNQSVDSYQSPANSYNDPAFGNHRIGVQTGVVWRSSQMPESGPSNVTQPYYTHQMPLTMASVNSANHQSLSSRILDRDGVKSRSERIKIIASAYAKLPPPVCHPSSCASVPPQESLYTL